MAEEQIINVRDDVRKYGKIMVELKNSEDYIGRSGISAGLSVMIAPALGYVGAENLEHNNKPGGYASICGALLLALIGILSYRSHRKTIKERAALTEELKGLEAKLQ